MCTYKKKTEVSSHPEIKQITGHGTSEKSVWKRVCCYVMLLDDMCAHVNPMSAWADRHTHTHPYTTDTKLRKQNFSNRFKLSFQ